jgi:hypothetical protein
MSQDVRHPGLEHSHIVILLYAGAGGASARIVKLSEWGELIMSMYSGNGITGEGVCAFGETRSA